MALDRRVVLLEGRVLLQLLWRVVLPQMRLSRTRT
jgi:hypothetical protein